MTGIFSIKDYKNIYLQREYSRFSKCILHQQGHIERCYNEGLITINERNQYLKSLSEMIRIMNNSYNSYMMDICDDHDPQVLQDIMPVTILKSKTIDATLCNEIIQYNSICKIIGTENLLVNKKENISEILFEPFQNILDEMFKMGAKIGFNTIYDAISIIIGEEFGKVYSSDQMSQLEIYNKIFIPLSYSIQNINNTNNINKQIFFVKKYNPSYEILIDNYAELHINKINSNHQEIVFEGYFNYDCLNIINRTSQICYGFIYQKKKQLEETLASLKCTNEKFKKIYIKNLSIGDIVSLDNDEFSKQFEEDITRYTHLTKLSFINLMKEFTKDTENIIINFKNIFQIIKLLLMGSDDNINIAGLLFGLTKDKKIATESIANLIYKNLNFISQIKLRKTSINIKNELEKIKLITVDDVDLKKQIITCKNMPPAVKKVAMDKVEEMKTSSNEYYKQMLYVKTLINFPWPSLTNDEIITISGKTEDMIKGKKFLEDALETLNRKVYGHGECKNEIQEIIGQWLSNPKSSGGAIGLVGPPGVGKTLIAKGIGDALKIPCVQITLGGQNDGELLYGHGYTYSAAQPGMVIKKMIEAGQSRCVMYFDELDKTCKKHDSNEIFNILIHLIDPNTNSEFQDRFFQEITFPLNEVIFVFSYNDSSLLDPILKDRIKEIEIKPYTLQDKVSIAKKFLIKEACTNIGIDSNSIKISDDNIEYIIDQYTSEAGVRSLKRKIESILLKLNIDRIYQRHIFEKRIIDDEDDNDNKNQITIDRADIIRYLDKPNISIRKIHPYNSIGIVNGMYATSTGGGGILPIHIYGNYIGSDKKFILKMTGSQGKVMKESVTYSFITAIHQVKKEIRDSFIKEYPYGLHIHTPSGSTPKDGPSAGCAFTTAYISKILKKKVKCNIAMTGEIEPTGKITAIGGLPYKLVGAKKAGVNIVYIPKENEDDLIKIKEENSTLICDDFKVVIVEHISEILGQVLLEDNGHCIDPKKYLEFN
ncbi:MAG: ATP-dependent Lon protease [Edafosvirus sp.]|uniref:ATP-dependent Lon protease n=1 Tax=Edafosvirus sp. TaxID=2487765 RepID=A0A3G4ZV14_9VIRU|nr:MAG: ATP-dependent Lon protease [Edafosvirus sp.]